jgi:hypothetical protein
MDFANGRNLGNAASADRLRGYAEVSANRRRDTEGLTNEEEKEARERSLRWLAGGWGRVNGVEQRAGDGTLRLGVGQVTAMSMRGEGTPPTTGAAEA